MGMGVTPAFTKLKTMKAVMASGDFFIPAYYSMIRAKELERERSLIARLTPLDWRSGT